MEGELWKAVEERVRQISQRYPRYRVQYGHRLIALVWLWATVHDRPMSWACRRESWP